MRSLHSRLDCCSCSSAACRHRSLLGPHTPHLPATAVLIHPLPQHFDRSWLAHATVKALMYEVEATIQVGACCRLLLSANS